MTMLRWAPHALLALLLVGCSPVQGTDRDGGLATDAATDAPYDAPADASADAAPDAPTDAAPDATADANPDASPDASVDARPDAAPGIPGEVRIFTPEPYEPVVFSNPDGTMASTIISDAAGEVTGVVPPGGSFTVIDIIVEVQFGDFWTVANPIPGHVYDYRPAPYPPSMGSMLLLPPARPDTSSYELCIPCACVSFASGRSQPVELQLKPGCASTNENDVMVVARDSAGTPQAFLIQRDVPVEPHAIQLAGTYQPTTGFTWNVVNLDRGIDFSGSYALFDQGRAGFTAFASAPLAPPGPHQVTTGYPAIGTGARIGADFHSGDAVQSIVTVRDQPTTSTTIDAHDLLGWVSKPTPEGLGVAWTVDDGAPADEVYVYLWQATHMITWYANLPPSARHFVPPVLPDLYAAMWHPTLDDLTAHVTLSASDTVEGVRRGRRSTSPALQPVKIPWPD